MVVTGLCQGQPNGQPCQKTSDLQVNSDDGCEYCKSCLRALRAVQRGSKNETPGGNAGNDRTSVTPLLEPGEVIFDPLLAYIASALQSGTSDLVRSAVIDRFSSAQVERAKKVLWDGSDSDVVGQLQKRKGTQGRTVKEANAADILEAYLRLDKAKKLPPIAILASDLHMIPRCHPEEVLSISAMDRMNRLEQRLCHVTDILDKVSADNALLRDEFETIRTSRDAVSCSDSDPADKNRQGGDKKKKSKKPGKGPRIPDIPGAATLAGASADDIGDISAQVEALLKATLGEDRQDEEPFTLIKSRREKQRERQQLVVGTADGYSTFKGANPNRHLFVYGVSSDTTEEDLKSYIETQLGAELKLIEIVPPSTKRIPGSNSQAFHVSVPLKDFDLLNKPESWPSGVKVRRYFPTRTTAGKK